MVKISQICNTLILDDEWVRFQGDSEYKDEEGNWHMGYWSFLGIVDDVPADAIILDFDDEVDEKFLYEDLAFAIRNSNGNICVVKFHYRKEEEE